MAQNNRVALVTGVGRLQGIGAAICRALAAQGIDICLTYWLPYDDVLFARSHADEPNQLVAEITALGRRCIAIEADLTLPDAPAQIFAAAETLGEVAILVNNAAYSHNEGYQTLSAAQLDAHYAVNMRGTFLLSVELTRRFKSGQGWRIINMTSGQSVSPMPEELAYAATKGAIEAFTRSLAAGVAHLGITVNAVDPGATDTGWMTPELEAHLITLSPQKRVGTPDDAARLVAFLASEDAAWITGQVIHSRGGL